MTVLDWNDEQPVLEGNVVRLELLKSEHTSRLWKVAEHSLENIFRYIPRRIRNLREFHKSIESALRERAERQAIPFVIVEKQLGQAIGMTRFRMVGFEEGKVEIAATWIAPPWQGVGINTEAKYLMLRYAFEQWECQRVEFRTAALNVESRKTLARIGGKEEETHKETFGGRVWEIIQFRILANEWPAIKAHLEKRLGEFEPFTGEGEMRL